MLAVFPARIDAADPLGQLEVGELPDPLAPEGWTTVSVWAASLKHHDNFVPKRGWASRVRDCR